MLILDLKPFRRQRKAFSGQKILETRCWGKETADIDILTTSRNGGSQIMQSIRITFRPHFESVQFIKVILIAKRFQLAIF